MDTDSQGVRSQIWERGDSKELLFTEWLMLLVNFCWRCQVHWSQPQWPGRLALAAEITAHVLFFASLLWTIYWFARCLHLVVNSDASSSLFHTQRYELPEAVSKMCYKIRVFRQASCSFFGWDCWQMLKGEVYVTNSHYKKIIFNLSATS